MALFDFLREAPISGEELNNEEIKRRYKYWRIRTFYSMYIGYAFYYLTRKSFTFAMPALMHDLGFTKTDLGILGSVLYIAYGLSKFFSGVLSDRSNPRYFMSFGLILTGIFNILFGFSSSIVLFALFWGLNGWFQGWGWPPCAKLLTHWYAQKERGTWWGLWNTSHNVGGALIPIIAAVLAERLGWRFAMYVPGVLCIGVGLFLINRLRDTPESLALPPIEEYKENKSEELTKNDKERFSKRSILSKYVLNNRFIWILGIAYFFVYVIRTAINDWGQLYLYEYKNFSSFTAGICISCFEIGGFFGSLGAGWFSDRLFAGRRAPVNVCFSMASVAAIAALWYVPSGAIILSSVIFFFVGFMVFGPQMLIGVAAAELSHKKAAGAATGFVGFFAYAGAAVAGFPLGKITQEGGWSMFFIALVSCAIVTVMVLAPLWSIRAYPKIAQEGAEKA